MTAQHSLSVIIAVFNGERFVASAVESVLAQKPDAEIIVVDDGSTDGSAAQLDRFGPLVRLIRSPVNEGLPNAHNRGLEAAGGSLIAFLDADDLWVPGGWKLREALIRHHEEADVLWGMTQVRFVAADGAEEERPDWPRRHYPSLGSMIFHRRVFDRVGRFAPELRHAPDIDLLARAREAGLAFRKHDDVVLYWRRHAANMTNDVPLDRDFFVSVVRSALHRRRAASPPES